MRPNRVWLLALLATLPLLGAADPPAKEIAGWGTFVDPDGDCEAHADGDALLLSVPATVHDLWPENSEPELRANAPRVLRDVDGDFTLSVTSVGPVLGGEFFRSAALVIWHDDGDFVRFERAGSFRDGKPRHYCWLHVFKDGKRVVNLQKEPVEEADTVLRLARDGGELRASFSQDGGKTFFSFPVQDISHLPETARAGVAALNASKAPFTARFAGVELTPNPSSAPAGQP